jgi:hypothetical protein
MKHHVPLTVLSDRSLRELESAHRRMVLIGTYYDEFKYSEFQAANDENDEDSFS